MNIYTASLGRGANSDRKWIAARDQGEAAAILGEFGREVRGLTLFRKVRDNDEITGPGQVAFGGAETRLQDKYAFSFSTT